MNKLYSYFYLKKEHLAEAGYIRELEGDEIKKISYSNGVMPADSLLFESPEEAEHFCRDILKLNNYRIIELNECNYDRYNSLKDNYKEYNYKGVKIIANLAMKSWHDWKVKKGLI